MTVWIQFYAEEDAKMMMMFQKKNVPKIDLTDKREALVFFPDQSFLYENTGFSSIFFWMGSRIKLSPPQDEISFVKDLDMSIKSVKAQKRHLFHQFLPFKSSLFFFICFKPSLLNCKKSGKTLNYFSNLNCIRIVYLRTKPSLVNKIAELWIELNIYGTYN